MYLYCIEPHASCIDAPDVVASRILMKDNHPVLKDADMAIRYEIPFDMPLSYDGPDEARTYKPFTPSTFTGATAVPMVRVHGKLQALDWRKDGSPASLTCHPIELWDTILRSCNHEPREDGWTFNEETIFINFSSTRKLDVREAMENLVKAMVPAVNGKNPVVGLSIKDMDDLVETMELCLATKYGRYTCMPHKVNGKPCWATNKCVISPCPQKDVLPLKN